MNSIGILADVCQYLLTAIFQTASWCCCKFIDIKLSTLLDFHISIPSARVVTPMKAYLTNYVFSQSHWMRTVQPSCSMCTTMVGRNNWVSQLTACWVSKPVPGITSYPVTYHSTIITIWWSVTFIVISVPFRIIQNGIIDVITMSCVVAKKWVRNHMIIGFITLLMSKVQILKAYLWLIYRKRVDFIAYTFIFEFWKIKFLELLRPSKISVQGQKRSNFGFLTFKYALKN